MYIKLGDGGNMFLQNTGIQTEDFTAQRPKRSQSEYIKFAVRNTVLL
jgi:hypothetical protein